MPDRRTGLALAAGMLTDSGHFRFANAALLNSMATVLRESSIGMDEIMDLTEMESDVSERVSQLKGAQRLRFDRVGDKIAAVSQGSAHESSVCRAIILAGADVAFVGSQRDENFRISARAKQEPWCARAAPGEAAGRGWGRDGENSGGGHGRGPPGSRARARGGGAQHVHVPGHGLPAGAAGTPRPRPGGREGVIQAFSKEALRAW